MSLYFLRPRKYIHRASNTDKFKKRLNHFKIEYVVASKANLILWSLEGYLTLTQR